EQAAQGELLSGYVGPWRLLAIKLCRCGGANSALGLSLARSAGHELKILGHQLGAQMPQGGHPPHHSITSSARASRGLAPMGWQDYKADGAIREGNREGAGER